MKKMIVLMATAAFIGGLSCAAFAGVKGEVVKVRGSKVTVEVSRSDAKDISKGDKVEMDVEKGAAAAPSGGNDMLTGC
ncbi:selenite/tellurite reduction operon protein ExtJ [Desulfuromonas acetoxidans]|uniref:DUF5666 domain-containing protein n=1 Tax=Desulfuromonas acetoxidans (strain DSM 684 / 11070) TaxID=281689 RepID=Q1JWG0_DESA6|nr:hypothetical protein [Desulfuromonas acetoxidans]EAT14608.1 hypothetical protein Dace_0437 [Desulfuromonas acetoxidans DSM 684]MBF0646247.1 hypothetical protein [Desulfuromonas acetoxidans]NVD25753.1 hypothetical protein [Desulfuromonas acetoxidans]NVE17049.1 hypothetical protein [Desulfuromonas acetoxidans]